MIKSHIIDPQALKNELSQFEQLLKKQWFEEIEASTLFKNSKNLIATFGNFNTSINNPDLIGEEVWIQDLVRCDFAAGDSKSRHFVLVEFEDAKTTSLFKNPTGGKKIPDWSARFEHGFSQLVDWAWIMNDASNSISVKTTFQGEVKDWNLLLIAGRNSSLNCVGTDRLAWRSKFASVHGHKVHHFTYDELYDSIVAKCLQSPYLK